MYGAEAIERLEQILLLKYLDFSLEEIPLANWKIVAHTFDLHHDADMNQGNVMTEYEEKFSSMGNPIHKLIARRDVINS